ncbi:MAG: hypothetical protein KA116_10710 [Proteobacteria bacterium]|nr:hypothetical protein [Pseudomonadota bacterium]
MENIPPGKLIDLKCPDGLAPGMHVGQRLPNLEKALAVVVSIHDKTMQVGFLKAGELTLDYPCANSQQQISVKIELPKDADKIKKFDPLNPFEIAYPGWIFWLVVGILVLFASGAAYIFYRKGAHVKKQKVKKREATIEEKIRMRMGNAAIELFLTETQQPKLRASYEEAINLFRSYLEDTLKLNTEYFTSKELVSYVRTLNSVKELDPQRMAQLEALFVRAEQIRFAGYFPTKEERESFLKDYSELFLLLQKRRVNELRPS